MYKLIALDLDDTLLDDTGDVSEENIRYLDLARKAGVVIVLCSGRPSLGMHKTIEKLGLNKEGEYYISFNGAVIRDCYEHKKIYQECLDKELADIIIDKGRKYDLGIQLYIEDELIVEKYTKNTERYERLVKVKAKVVDNLKEYTDKGVIKILINDDSDKLKKVQHELQTILKDKLHMFLSRDHLLEFISIKTNKGVAVLELAKRLGIEKDEVIAVGDSYNDVYMIEMVGLGVTVSNGRQEVKDIAKYVTIASNNEHAIKEVIEKFVLNKE